MKKRRIVRPLPPPKIDDDLDDDDEYDNEFGDARPNINRGNGLIPLANGGYVESGGLQRARAASALDETEEVDEEEPPPIFMVDLIPGDFGKLISAVADTYQVPSDLVLVLALGTVAASTMGRLQVDAGPNWKEITNLYVAGVARSGERKTPLISFLTDPILETEQALREASKDDIIRAEVQQSALETAAQLASKRAGKEAGNEDALEEAREAAIEASYISVPVPPVLTCFDATPERIATLAFEQGGRLAIIGDEGTPLDIVAGYYNKSTPNFGVLLKGYDGGWYRRDRQTDKESQSGPISLNMVLAVQPHVVRSIAAAPGAKERGLLARFLIAEPASNIGWREIKPPPIPSHLVHWWQAFIDSSIRHYWSRSDHETQMETVALSKAAAAKFDQFRSCAEKQRRPGGNLDVEPEWSNKLDGRVVRIAALLALVRSGADEPFSISGEDMEVSIELSEWSVAHAARVLGRRMADIVDDEIEEDAKRIVAWMKVQKKEWITMRDIQRNSPVRSRTRLEAALTLLEDERRIRSEEYKPLRGPVGDAFQLLDG